MASRLWKIIKKNLFAMITIVLSVSILFYFLFTTDGITALSHIYKTIRIWWLFMAILAAFAAWLCEGYALHVFCTHVYPQWPFGYSFTVAMIGLLYSALTPFSTGGQPMQIYAMRKMGMDTGMAGSIIAMKTLVWQVITVCYSLTFVILKLHYFQTTVTNFSFVTIIGLISNFAFIGFVILFSVSERITDNVVHFVIRVLAKLKLCKHPKQRYDKIHDELCLFHSSTKTIGKSIKTYVITTLFTIVQISATCLIPYFIYRSFNFHTQSVSTMMAAQAFVAMVSAFVPLPGASGGAEGSFYLFFSSFFTSGTIVPAIMLWRTISYYFNILFGSICLWVSKKLPAKQLTAAQKYN